MKKLLMLLTALWSGIFLFSAEEKLLLGIYPDMREFKLTPPAAFRPLSRKDLTIDVERIRRLKNLRPLPADRETLIRIAEFYRDDPNGRKSWNDTSVRLMRYINSWSLPKNVVPAYQLRYLGTASGDLLLHRESADRNIHS